MKANERRGGRCRLAAALAALPVLGAVADPLVEVTGQHDGGFQLTLKVDEAIGVGAGQRLLLPTAVRLCAGLAPRLGAYEYGTRETLDGDASADSFVLVQDFECGAAERAGDGPPGRELGDLERAEIERVARARTAAYHEALADGDDRAALAMFPGFSAASPPDEAWRGEQAAFREKAGVLVGVDVWRATVYVDPPGASGPGIYVATDLEVSYENLTVCGYFVWFEMPDGTLRITYRDVGELRAALASTLTASQLAEARAGIRCRPGTVPD